MVLFLIKSVLAVTVFSMFYNSKQVSFTGCATLVYMTLYGIVESMKERLAAVLKANGKNTNIKSYVRKASRKCAETRFNFDLALVEASCSQNVHSIF